MLFHVSKRRTEEEMLFHVSKRRTEEDMLFHVSNKRRNRRRDVVSCE